MRGTGTAPLTSSLFWGPAHKTGRIGGGSSNADAGLRSQAARVGGGEVFW